MVLWLIFAGMTAAALVAVCWPLVRSEAGGAARSAHDSEVYRDQLVEIESDLERGLIAPAEAEAAKLEIARRLLAAADEAGEVASGRRPVAVPRLVLGGLVIGVPALSLAVYLLYGSPLLEGKPYAARLAQPSGDDEIAVLVAKVEERLRENPLDGEGWDVIAPVYLKSGRYRDAGDAYGRAIALLGESPRRLSGYAEALILANNGIVAEEARAAYEKSLRQDPHQLKPRFWLAMAMEQDGRFADAAAAWRELLSLANEESAWRGLVAERLRVAEAKLRDDSAAAGEKAAAEAPEASEQAPGPSAEDVAAAQQLSAEQRLAMINQMVDGLAERLKEDGSDLNGWLRLVRAYAVLGKRDAATEALAEARRNFDKDANARARLDDLVKTLGL